MNRIEKLMKALPENADAAIITSDVNRRYFTGLGSSAGTLLAFRDAAYFIIDFRYIEVAKATVTGAEVILQDKLYEQLGELLKKHGARTVAIETGYLTVGELDGFEECWADWLKTENEHAVGDRRAMEAGAGRYMNFVYVVVRKGERA